MAKKIKETNTETKTKGKGKAKAKPEAQEEVKEEQKAPAKGKGKGKADKPAEKPAEKPAKDAAKAEGKAKEDKPAKEPAKEESKAGFEVAQPKTMSLNAISKAIAKQIEIGSKTTLKMGELLYAAREQHFTKAPKKEGGKPKVDGKGFLAWADEQFSIKKAYCYNLIKVYTVFHTMPDFHDVPYMVLINLATDEAMLNAATDALAAGETVDTVWLKAYAEEKAAAEKEAKRQERIDAGEDPDAEEEEEDDTGSNAGAASGSAASDMDDKYILELEAKIEELEKAAAAAPVMDKLVKRLKKLPAYLVLQVPADADKRTVNAAARDLKAIYGASDEVMAIVEAAKAEMTK